jgi:MFS family permease
VVTGVGALIYGFVQAGNHGWGSTQTDVSLAAGAALLAVFIGIELRSRNPLIRFGLFRSRTISGGNLVALTFGAGAIAVWFYLALYLQQVEHYSALKAGVASLPLNATLMTTATLSPKWITRFGPKPVLAGGLAVFAAGMFWLHYITATGSYTTDVLGPIIVIGAGLGVAFVGVTVAAVTGVDPEESGLASGLYNTTLQVGEAIGLAILTTISTTGADHDLARHTTERVALTHGFRDALLVGAGVLMVAVLLSLFVLSNKANRDFVRLARSGDPTELEIEADALSELEGPAGIAAIAGLKSERELNGAEAKAREAEAREAELAATKE